MATDRGQAATIGIVFVGLAIIAVGGLYVYNAAYSDVATNTETFVNETSTDTTGLVQLNESGKTTVIYFAADNVTAYDENGTEMTQPDDFTWNRLNGTVNINSTGRIEGDANFSITYGYHVGSEQAQGILQLTDVQRTVMKLMLFVVGLALVATALRVFMG